MPIEQVRMWHPADDDRELLMAGQTTSYAMDPRGEYVFGIVTGQPMRSRCAHERRLVLPGQLVAWDPFGAHSGCGPHPPRVPAAVHGLTTAEVMRVG